MYTYTHTHTALKDREVSCVQVGVGEVVFLRACVLHR